MKYALRAAVSALMLGVVLVLAGAVALGLVAALILALSTGGAWAVAAGVVVVALLGTGGVAMFSRRRRQDPPSGVPITSDEQPLLWVEVYRVAEGLGARPPDELVLFPDTDVEVTEHQTWLGLRPGVRRLRLGLPLLTGLTERQLRAVIAHELCRFSGSTLIARVIYRGQRTCGRVADRLGDASLVGRIVGRYGRAYLAVSRPVIRRHDLEADRLSADLAGNGTTSAGLREIDVLSKGWDAFVAGYAEPAAALGRRPEDLFAGFTRFLEEPGRRGQLADTAGVSRSSPRSAYNSLPSLRDRLAAIEALPEDHLHDKSGPALGLMRNPDHVIRRVEESMFPESGFVPAAWEDIVLEAGSAAASQDAQKLRRLAHEGGLGPALSIATLLELLRHGLADEMVRPLLAEGASAEVERQMAVRLVTGFLSTAAIESGTASYRFSWAAPLQLVDEQGVVDDLPRLVDTALADGTEVSALELWLAAHDVGQELELVEDQGLDGQQDPPDPDGSPADHATGDPAPQLVTSTPTTSI